MTCLLLLLAVSPPTWAQDLDAPSQAPETTAPDEGAALDDDLQGEPEEDHPLGEPVARPIAELDDEYPLGEIVVPAPVHGWPRTADGIGSAIEELLPHLEECIAMVEAEDPADDTGESIIQLSMRLRFEMTREGLPGPITQMEGDEIPSLGCITGALSTLRFEPGEEAREVQVPLRLHISR